MKNKKIFEVIPLEDAKAKYAWEKSYEKNHCIYFVAKNKKSLLKNLPGPLKRLYHKGKLTIRERKPGVIKKVGWQTGERISIDVDRERKAMSPGKRLSKSGRIYWETRRNRSDLKKNI